MASSRKRRASAQGRSTLTKRITRSQKPAPKSFFDLPPEIRNAIYDLALPESSPITVKKQYGGPPLTFVSKAVRSECLSVYLSGNTFNVDEIDLQTWADAVGIDKLFAHVSRLQFQVRAYCTPHGDSFFLPLDVFISLVPDQGKHNMKIWYEMHNSDPDEYQDVVALEFYGQGRGGRYDRSVAVHTAFSALEKFSDLTFTELLKLRSKMTISSHYYDTYILKDTWEEAYARDSWVPHVIKPIGGLRPRRDLKNLSTGIGEDPDGNRNLSGGICDNIYYKDRPVDDEGRSWPSGRSKTKLNKGHMEDR